MSGCDDFASSDAQKKYETIRDELLPSLLVSRAIDQEMRSEIEEIMSSWAKSDELPSHVEAEALVVTGLAKNIHGLVELWTISAPVYSRDDEVVNRHGNILMLTQAILLPKTVDGFIHYDDGMAMIKITERNVVIYLTGENGIEGWIYHLSE